MRNKMMDMQRLKELRIVEQLTAPYVPAACPILWGMTKGIERKLRECGKRYAKTLILARRLKQRAELLTDFRLRCELHHAA